MSFTTIEEDVIMTASHAADPAVAVPAEPVVATEVVLPGLVEPDGLQIRQRTLPSLGAGEALVRVEAIRCFVRRAGYAARPLPRAAEVPVHPWL